MGSLRHFFSEILIYSIYSKSKQTAEGCGRHVEPARRRVKYDYSFHGGTEEVNMLRVCVTAEEETLRRHESRSSFPPRKVRGFMNFHTVTTFIRRVPLGRRRLDTLT